MVDILNVYVMLYIYIFKFKFFGIEIIYLNFYIVKNYKEIISKFFMEYKLIILIKKIEYK